MTSKIIVNSIEADAGIGSITFNDNIFVGDINVTGTSTLSNIVVDGGSVGIGTDIPAYTLDLGESPSTIRLVSESNGTAIRVGPGGNGNVDVTLLRVDGTPVNHDGETDDSAFGFSVKYMGSRSSNNNSLSIFGDNQTGTQVEAITINQDGSTGIGTDNPTEILTVAGNVRVENSVDAAQYLNLTYQGIDFQNTGAGSSTSVTSHLLDDYEEGTFTPTITSGLTNPVLSGVAGYYVKVGTLVMCSIDFRINGTQSGNGNPFQVGNLPFSSNQSGGIYGSATINYNNILSGFTELRAGHFNETSVITFYNGTTGINGNTAGVSFADQRRLIMQLVYKSV